MRPLALLTTSILCVTIPLQSLKTAPAPMLIAKISVSVDSLRQRLQAGTPGGSLFISVVKQSIGFCTPHISLSLYRTRSISYLETSIVRATIPTQFLKTAPMTASASVDTDPLWRHLLARTVSMHLYTLVLFCNDLLVFHAHIVLSLCRTQSTSSSETSILHVTIPTQFPKTAPTTAKTSVDADPSWRHP